LSRNFDTFSNFLGNIDHKFSFIALSETWLKSSENAFEIAGYNFIHDHRHNRTGGGVGNYIFQPILIIKCVITIKIVLSLCLSKFLSPERKTLLSVLFTALLVKILMNSIQIRIP
jgi:uncharacterized membrane protein